ncbi:hypothetical protein CORC01_04789, partial [Colletotrichum orchidophilum]
VNFNLLFWFFLFGAVSVYAGTCTIQPQSNLDSRINSAFVKRAKDQCQSAGGSPKQGNSASVSCTFRGDAPNSFQRTSNFRVNANGRNVDVRAKVNCSKR